MKAIASLFTAITASPYSHGSGYIRIFTEQLEAAGIEHEIIESKDRTSWNDFDEIYLWQGLDLNGKLSMNLFGGTCSGNAEILNRLAHFKGKVTPIIYPALPYHELKSRDWSHVPEITRATWTNLERRVYANPIKNPYSGALADWITVGDSHAPSVARHAYNPIEVLSGMTLHRALRTEGLRRLVPEKFKRATIYFGQIDLRHHLCRLDHPELEVLKLANEYVHQARQLQLRDGCELCELHPIEDESRQIPTPGRYKGLPFYGSWEQRDHLRQVFNDRVETQCHRHNLEFKIFPRKFIGRDGKMDQEFMERPRSVHIAPKYYRCFDLH